VNENEYGRATLLAEVGGQLVRVHEKLRWGDHRMGFPGEEVVRVDLLLARPYARCVAAST